MVQSEWGDPKKGRILIKAPGPDLNPYWWTPERCEEMKRDPKAYRTDVLAEFSDAEEALFPQEVITRSTRKEPRYIEWQRGHEYVAAMDPAARANAWTLIVADRKGPRKRVVCATQWQGTSSQPLRPGEVLIEIAEILDHYGLNWAYTDQWSAEAIKDLAMERGLYLSVEDWTTATKINSFLSIAAQMAEGLIELPPDPILAKDLKLVKKLPTSRGVSVQLSKTPDGRHCDYAPALALAMHRWIDEDQRAPPEKGSGEYWKDWEDRMVEQEEDELKHAGETDWWDHNPFGGFLQ
jgi:hypothetical protein